jgi:preprotein translocase subunit SecY
MKTLRGFFAIMISGILNRTFLMAQEPYMSAEELEVMDSSHLEEEFFADAVMDNSASGPNVIIIIALIVVIAAVVYFVVRKRKLKHGS